MMKKDTPISHSMLSCFLDCRMKYWKRYEANIYWPGTSESQEMKKGKIFHRLSQGWFNRLDQDLTELPGDVVGWFVALKKFFPLEREKKYIPEKILETELRLEDGSFFKLLVRLDLMVVDDSGITILDFKTGQIKSDGLSERQSLQELVYMTAVAEELGGNQPLKMIFWSPVKGVLSQANYDWARHEENKQKLKSLVDNLKSFDPSGFQRDELNKACRFCPYAKIC